MNDRDARERRRAAIVRLIAQACAQIARDRADIIAIFSFRKKCPYNGRFLIVLFSQFDRARAGANANASGRKHHGMATDMDAIAVKNFLYRTRAKAPAMTESRFERANQRRSDSRMRPRRDASRTSKYTSAHGIGIVNRVRLGCDVKRSQ